jgi:branched-chain amino acid transport system substrate-binding protein
VGYARFRSSSSAATDLRHENVMRQPANLKQFRTAMLLPGISINTGPH